MIHDFNKSQHGEILAKLTEIIELGHLKPLLDDENFKLTDVGAAYDRLESGSAIGKVVVEN